MATRKQNRGDSFDRVPGYYVNHNLYPGAYTRNDWVGRTSRRMHEGLSVDRNYGLDTTADDVDSSTFSSPFYINGRYNSSNLTTQRGNSASVQGTTRLATIHDKLNDFTEAEIETTIKLWQGKQIRFTLPFQGKIVGNTISIKNTRACTGILSIYISATPEGQPIYETAVDLCKVSQDYFDHLKLYAMTPVPASANIKGEVYVRMEIWDELTKERQINPFNTGNFIEIAATGKLNHTECILSLGDKNEPVRETYEFVPALSAPLMAFIYNDYESVPTVRNEGQERGATVSRNGYAYDLFCIKNSSKAELVVFDRNTNQATVVNSVNIDGRVEELGIIQLKDYVYYVDGYSPMQKFRIGEWISSPFPVGESSDVSASINSATFLESDLGKESGSYLFRYINGSWQYNGQTVSLSTYGITLSGAPAPSAEILVVYYEATSSTPAEVTATYADTRPVVAASKILLHHNRVYLSGFRYDKNLVQFSRITEEGPDFDSYPYRFYAPDSSPLANTTNPITALVEYETDSILISFAHGDSVFTTNVNVEDAMPQQVSTYVDGAGVASSGDITNYRGIVYSFDPDEGIRRFTGQTWNRLPGMEIDTLFERVDLSKPRKLWGYAYKLYFNYTDSIDGKAKCIIWDMKMDRQQYPFFQDSGIPFCDVRADDDFDLIGIHPDFPCIMRLYDADIWRRLDTPIEFRRDTKYLSLPGNAADMLVKRVQIKTIANSSRWWWVSLSFDVHSLEQHRGGGHWYRVPVWDTIKDEQAPEEPFAEQSIYEEKAIALSTIPHLRAQAISTQVRVRAKTFRSQANLVSVLIEAAAKAYI